MKPTKLYGLGGLLEIGKKMIVIEHDNEIVLIDAGIKFTDSMTTGARGIVPNYAVLNERNATVKALFITHGHEDHIGGIPYLLREVKPEAIYAPKLAIELIKLRLKEHKISENSINFVEVQKETTFESEHFKADFWTSQHSIPDSFGVRVSTINGKFFDTGDFRIDYNPIGNLSDIKLLEKLGDEGIDVYTADSTNSFNEGHSPSESLMTKSLEEVIKNTNDGKLIVTTFASQVIRVKVFIDLAKKYNKKVIPFGRSMIKVIEVGRKLKIIDVDDSVFIDKKQISSIPDNKLMIISTGSQGEEMAALNRMASGNHQQITLTNKDTVLFSASPIPGNRLRIEQLVNRIYKRGTKVLEHRIDGHFHTSGHAYQEELKLMFEKLKPTYFIPSHGSYRQGAAHIIQGIKSGLNPKNWQLEGNGFVWKLEKGILSRTDEKIDHGPIYIDGEVTSKATSQVISKRKDLRENGFVNVVAQIDKEKSKLINVRVVSRGLIYIKEDKDTIHKLQSLSHRTILYTINKNNNWTNSNIKELLTQRIQDLIYKIRRRKPLVIVSILPYSSKEIAIARDEIHKEFKS
ncbi:MAG: ribonuclease J [Mollicutes bacterium PWAP]|nr:ribonuclease J [Mollicutes bacterium PWAP]